MARSLYPRHGRGRRSWLTGPALPQRCPILEASGPSHASTRQPEDPDSASKPDVGGMNPRHKEEMPASSVARTGDSQVCRERCGNSQARVSPAQPRAEQPNRLDLILMSTRRATTASPSSWRGLGGAAAAGSPAVACFVGGTMADAAAITE